MKRAVVSTYNLAVILWVAAGLFIALASPAAAVVFKLLIPDWFFFALVVVAGVLTQQDTWIPQLAPSLSVLSPRPPPIR